MVRQLKSFLVAMAMSTALSTAALAETVTLQGDYVKIGTSHLGTIGSIGNTPPGIQYDNTGTGTFNAAYDYLTPGSPFEGWTIKGIVDGSAFTATNNNTGMTGVTGTLTDTSGTVYDNSVEWSGTHTHFSVTHYVFFNDEDKYVDIKTIITANNDITNLQFGRFTDPDARAAPGDSSATTNTLGFDPIPTTQVVFSEATVSKYALGLYSADDNVGAGISNMWSTDPNTYYTGNNSGSGDYTIGLGWSVPALAAGESAEFHYAYIFGPSTLAAGATAVSAGVGGGEPGVVPGCETDCGMPGVEPPEPPPPPPPPPPPTVVSESTTEGVTTTVTLGDPTTTRTYTDRPVTTVDGEAIVVTVYRDYTDTATADRVTTTVTTPVTTKTWSDGTTTTVTGTAVSSSVTENVVVGTTNFTEIDSTHRTVDQSATSVAYSDATVTTSYDERPELTKDDRNNIITVYKDHTDVAVADKYTTTTITPVTTSTWSDGSVTTSTGEATSSTVTEVVTATNDYTTVGSVQVVTGMAATQMDAVSILSNAWDSGIETRADTKENSWVWGGMSGFTSQNSSDHTLSGGKFEGGIEKRLSSDAIAGLELGMATGELSGPDGSTGVTAGKVGLAFFADLDMFALRLQADHTQFLMDETTASANTVDARIYGPTISMIRPYAGVEATMVSQAAYEQDGVSYDDGERNSVAPYLGASINTTLEGDLMITADLQGFYETPTTSTVSASAQGLDFDVEAGDSGGMGAKGKVNLQKKLDDNKTLGLNVGGTMAQNVQEAGANLSFKLDF